MMVFPCNDGDSSRVIMISSLLLTTKLGVLAQTVWARTQQAIMAHPTPGMSENTDSPLIVNWSEESPPSSASRVFAPPPIAVSAASVFAPADSPSAI